MHSLPNQEPPTLENPARGTVYTVVNGRRFRISDAEYWVEAKTVTVRSREFDCFATGESPNEALRNFDRAVLRYADALQEREDRCEATESEQETLKELSARLSRIYREERRGPRKRKSWLRLRLHRGGHDRHDWGPVPV